jgi:FO synthase
VAVHGEETPPEAMETIITSIERRPRQRTTLYGEAGADRIAASFNAVPLRPPPVIPTHRLALGM